jgi:hypothetical protein
MTPHDACLQPAQIEAFLGEPFAAELRPGAPASLSACVAFRERTRLNISTQKRDVSSRLFLFCPHGLGIIGEHDDRGGLGKRH